jgi:hypothetical protein
MEEVSALCHAAHASFARKSPASKIISSAWFSLRTQTHHPNPCPPTPTPNLYHVRAHLHLGSCGYGYLWKDEPLGWDVAAATDFMDGYEDVSLPAARLGGCVDGCLVH